MQKIIDCPNCKTDLREISNEQLQHALSKLSQINRKNNSFDDGDFKNFIVDYFKRYCNSAYHLFVISEMAVQQ
jgi:hypothetical protein